MTSSTCLTTVGYPVFGALYPPIWGIYPPMIVAFYPTMIVPLYPPIIGASAGI